MGNENSKTSSSANVHDVTEVISKAVGKMIARAAVNKNDGKEFDVDLKKCENFIELQIELIAPLKPDEGVIYHYISIVRNGLSRPIHIPISHESITDHTAKHKSSHGIGVKGTIRAEATVGDEASHCHSGGQEKKKDKGDKNPSAPTASANLTASITPEVKINYSDDNIDKKHEEHHRGEIDMPRNAKFENPRGKRICNLQLELRALKKAKLTVYRKSVVSPEAGVGIGLGAAGGAVAGAAGGAAAGAAIGIIVPGVGNLIGGAIGGVVGGIGGVIAGGAAAAGIGGGAVHAHLALNTITLTAEDIFKESALDDVTSEKDRYIHCFINYPYEVDFDNVYINRN